MFNRTLEQDISSIKAKLKNENCNIQDFKKCMNVLERTVAPVYCQRIYKDYIYNYNS